MKRYLSCLKNQKGQGTTEYIIILAIAVSPALVVFWDQIKPKLSDKVGKIASGIERAGADNP